MSSTLKHLRLLSLGLLLFVGVGMFGTSAHAATTSAQCAQNPKLSDCLSFDPAINPFLQAQGLKISADSDIKNPKNLPDDGLCVSYAVTGGTALGCIQDGVFKINGSAPTGGGVKATVDPTGNVVIKDTDPIANGALSCIGSGIIQCAITAVGSAMLGISNLLLGIAGTLFNFVVIKTVFQFSSIIGNSPGLLVAWKILRDLGNMALLFGFIFIGISTILDLHTYTAQKALPRLIIFAVLINFSLFAAEAVIDISNVFSSVMYSQANTDPCVTDTSTVQVSGTGTYDLQNNLKGTCGLDYGIAGHIMESSGLSTIFSTKEPNVGIAVYIGLSLFALIGAVVMFAAAIMLAIRAVTLTFLMVLAPLGFAGMAIPPFQNAAKKWWSTLIHQAFFAPILLLLLFVSLKVADGFGTVTGGGLAGALSQPNVSTMGIFLVFTLVIGFMVASLMMAKNFGAMGAGFAIGLAGKVGGASTFGVGGWAGRATVGRASAKFAQSVRKSSIGSTEIGRRLAGLGDKGSHASFDVRATKTVTGAAKAGGLDFGKAQKGGFHGSVEEARKVREKYAGSLKMSKQQEARDKQLKDEKKVVSDAWKKRKSDIEKEIDTLENFDEAAEKLALDTEIDTQNEKLAQGMAAGDAAASQAASDELAKLFASLQDVSNKAKRNEERLAELNAELDSGTQAQKTKIETLESEISKNNPSTQYANNLDDFNHSPIGQISRVAGVSYHARHEAAVNIKKNANKSKTDKAFDALKEEMKKKEGGDDHDGGGDSKPEPKATRGGSEKTASSGGGAH